MRKENPSTNIEEIRKEVKIAFNKAKEKGIKIPNFLKIKTPNWQKSISEFPNQENETDREKTDRIFRTTKPKEFSLTKQKLLKKIIEIAKSRGIKITRIMEKKIKCIVANTDIEGEKRKLTHKRYAKMTGLKLSTAKKDLLNIRKLIMPIKKELDLGITDLGMEKIKEKQG